MSRMSSVRPLVVLLLMAALAVCANATNSSNTTSTSIVVPPLKWQAILFIVLLVAFVIVLSTGLLRILPAMTLMAVVLFLSQLVTTSQLFVGFSNNGNLSIALLFIIVKPISQLPLVKRLVEVLMRGSSEGQRWPLFKLCLVSMLLSSFLENTPHVAIFTAMITRYCTDHGLPASRYLMPMSFAVILGNYAVFGSGSNLVISGLMEENHLGAFPTFELAKAGLPTLPFVLAYLVFLPKYLIVQDKGDLAKRTTKSTYILKCRIEATSSLLERPYKAVPAAFPGGDESGVGVRRVLRGEEKLEPEAAGNVAAGDIVAFTGSPTQLVLAAQLLGYTILSANDADIRRAPFEAYAPGAIDSLTPSDQPQTPEGAFYEIVLSGSTKGIGCAVATRQFQTYYRLSIASIRSGTDGQDLGMAAMPTHVLGAADTLVCYGTRDFADQYNSSPDFLLIAPIGAQEKDVHPLVYRFPKWVPWGTLVKQGSEVHKAFVMPAQFRYVSLLLFVGIVILSSIEITKLANLCLVTVVVYVILGLTTAQDAVHTVHYEVYVVVAFSFPLGSALQNSGLATTIGAAVANANITGFPLLLLISVLSIVFANLITNIASAQVMLPLILSIYKRLPQENQLAAISTSAQVIVCAIMTPYSIPPNMLIFGPGGYTPKDYLKLGLPLSMMFTLLVPFWSAVVYGEFSK